MNFGTDRSLLHIICTIYCRSGLPGGSIYHAALVHAFAGGWNLYDTALLAQNTATANTGSTVGDLNRDLPDVLNVQQWPPYIPSPV